MKKILFITFFALFQVAFSQEKGTVKGIVTDRETNNETFPFVNVFIKNTTIGKTTDMDGAYKLSVPVGKHILVFSFIGYKTVEKNIEIIAGKTIIVNQLLSAKEGVSLDEIKITATKSREKESALILEQKKAVSIKTAIGAQELAKKGISNASSAVAKTAGVAKQQGTKNVVVRGLGDRYNATSYNGLPLPSEDPEYKNISLDFFSTNIIQSIGVNKVFSSTIYGDVGGANIDIVSKKLNKKKLFSLSISSGGNSQTISKNNFLTIDGSNKFGNQNLHHPIKDLNTYSFANSFKPSSQNTQVNKAITLSAGRKFNIGDSDKLSLFAVVGFNNDYHFVEGNIKQTNNAGNVFLDQDFKKYNYTVSQIVMANASYKFKDNNITYNHLFIHNNKQSIGDYFGTVDPQQEGDLEFQRRQQVNNNLLFVNQLLGDFKISDRITIAAKGSLNYIRGNEPDRRTNTYLLRDGFYSPQTSSAGENERYYAKLEENDYTAKGSITYKLKENEDDNSSLTFGADYRYTERLFASTIFNHGFSTRVAIDIENPDAIFNQQSLTSGIFSLETGRGRSNNPRVFDPFTYRGKRLMSGFFSTLVYQFNNNLIASFGVKAEKSDQKVTYDTNIASSYINGPSRISVFYILPNFTVKYNFSENSILRFAGSQTYTFPQFKETAPFKYQDISFSSQGNPDVRPSDNYNFDTKYEYYFSSKEMMSITGFYKYINNPIARSEIPSGGNTLTYLNVGKNATVFGLEVELKKTILENDNDKHNYVFSGGFNASFLTSKVYLDNLSIAQFTNATSKLEGATPFLMNADVTYIKKYTKTTLTTSLVLNYASDKVYSIGTRGFENIIEKGVATLDWISSFKLSKKSSIKLQAKNLINPSFQLSRVATLNGNNIVLRNYKKGVNLSLGYSFHF